MEPFDVISMGRVGVDLYPLRTSVGLEDVTSYGKYLGGSATNAAVAAARYGRRRAVINVKQGPHGVLAVDDAGAVEVPPVPARVINGLGTGDAFGGALCHGLLSGWDTARTMAFANPAGAAVAGRPACADAMPTAARVEALLSGVGIHA